MPKYVRGNGKFRRKKLFQDNHMCDALCRISKSDPAWKEHFVSKAQRWLDGVEVPPAKLKRSALRAIVRREPYQLAGDILLTRQRKRDTDEIEGGGIPEAIHTLASTIGNLVGIPKIKELLFGKAKHKEIPDELKLVASALDKTYFEIDKRPDTVGSLTRMKELDTDRYSVWMQPNNQLLVTVHGTKMDSVGDLFSDARILAGDTNVGKGNSDLRNLFQQLDDLNLDFDVAAHSLGTELTINSLKEEDNVDNIYLFNPSSSPFQNSDILKQRANDEKYTYFINPSDVVSHGLYQQMSDDSISRNYMGSYNWNLATAHSLGQWLPDDDASDKKEPEETAKTTDE